MRKSMMLPGKKLGPWRLDRRPREVQRCLETRVGEISPLLRKKGEKKSALNLGKLRHKLDPFPLNV